MKFKTVPIILTLIMQIVCIASVILGKFTLFEFVISVTLLDILYYFERIDLEVTK